MAEVSGWEKALDEWLEPFLAVLWGTQGSMSVGSGLPARAVRTQ
jgi:hypothetical protein